MDNIRGSTGATRRERGEVGPFNGNEIQLATKNAVNGLALRWDELTSVQKEAFVEEAIGTLTGVPTSRFADLPVGMTPAIEADFLKLVLQEFQNSSKWDLDEFNAGYANYKGITGREILQTPLDVSGHKGMTGGEVRDAAQAHSRS